MTASAGSAAAGRAIDAIVALEGTAACAQAITLCAPEAPTRDLADAIHAFCALHGSAPSVVELAARSNGALAVYRFMNEAAAAFDEERRLLATLAAAIGPVPSTPRHAQAHATIDAQRHALATLACSDRAGCALGAALALVLDWHAIRAVLAAAAARTGIALLPTDLAPAATIAATAQAIAAGSAGQARALRFGAEQLILQHRGLWQLLAARAEARDAR